MAIRKNAEFMHEVIDKMDYMVRVMDLEHRVVYMNKKMRDIFGHTIGNMCYEIFGNNERCQHCITTGAKYTGQPDSKDVEIEDRFYRVMSSPVNLGDDKSFSIELFQDITDQKKTELELLKHYKKLKDDIQFAKHIQTQALPKDGIYCNSFKIDSSYVQSEDLGGDLFDVVKLDDDRCFIYISDVSGHGIKSSLLTIFLRQVIRGTKTDSIYIKDILNELIKNFNDLNVGYEQYLTILGGIYDKKLNRITFANAGHNCLPIFIKKGKDAEEIVVNGMPICSLINKSNHETVTLDLNKGDRIALYTDGISEIYNSSNDKEFGAEGIIKTINRNLNVEGNTLINKVMKMAINYSDRTPIDDMAILIMEIL
ncbi:SpoIIE family protein phosphatase [Anaerovorax odorimutans]|uniref:SpoIIE family protein phosphatase n=1 Tax=Anaerovorax odorimutans TaxID=109327 RepID=UPI000418CF2E|nr:SpoIIE family protein phosphatase [Anaerovorax odorimutans]